MMSTDYLDHKKGVRRVQGWRSLPGAIPFSTVFRPCPTKAYLKGSLS